MWKKALTIPDNVELEKTAESGAPRAAYREKKEKPGKPSRSHPPCTGSTLRSNSWSPGNMMPTMDIFPRSMMAGVPITDLFPSMSQFRMKPDMMSRIYVDDIRIIENEEDLEDKDDEKEQSDPRAGQRMRQEKRQERNRGSERDDPEGVMRSKPSGSNTHTPKRKDKGVAMMANSPKIMTYFVKKEQVEGMTRDVKMTQETSTKHERNAVKQEQVEGMTRDMKMTQEITIKHERNAENKNDLEIETETGEYYEDYKEEKPTLLKMEPGLSATKEVAQDSARDVVVDMVTDLKYEEETRNMITPETVMENETQSEEHDSPRPTGLEVGTEQVAASEVAARSATYD